MAESGNWIAGATKNKGALHRKLGVPEGEKIPNKKIVAAEKKGGTLGKEARLAETLKGFHKGSKKDDMKKPEAKKDMKMAKPFEKSKMDKDKGMKEGSKADMKQDKKEMKPMGKKPEPKMPGFMPYTSKEMKSTGSVEDRQKEMAGIKSKMLGKK